MAGKPNRRPRTRATARAAKALHPEIAQADQIDLAALSTPGKSVRDVRKLKSAELLQLLNSTPLGPVLTERQIFTQRMTAGLRIAAAGAKDNRRIDMLRYAAWLCGQRHANVKTAKRQNGKSGAGGGGSSPIGERAVVDEQQSSTDAYSLHKERARARQASISDAGTDIGPLPPVGDLKRRESCKGPGGMLRYAETYFKARFPLPWSNDHLKYWVDLEEMVIDGGQLAEAMPRGSGKSTMAEVAELYAVSYGYRRYPVLIGASRDEAVKLVANIRKELETNELLSADFPEICYPIACLNGNTKLCAKQHISGERTNIQMKERFIVLPTVRGGDGQLAPTSGLIIEVRSLTGSMRGLRHILPDGSVIRPDLVLVDDPQTKASARSVRQCATREAILHGDVMGLAGPGQKISCMVTCTVIAKGDVADRILDRGGRPQWQGVRVAMVKRFPADPPDTAQEKAFWKLWEEYADLRKQCQRDGDRHAVRATKFYRKNKAAMDEGVEVYWTARFNPDEISAIQNAMNWRIDDPESFWAECQNAPRDEVKDSALRLTEKMIARKVSGPGGVPRGVIPLACHQLVAFIDVQESALFWMMCAFGEHFTGAIIDYGTWPDQGRTYYSKLDCRNTIKRAFGDAGDFDSRLYSALNACVEELSTRTLVNEAGSVIPMSRKVIDANWGKSTNIIYQFCRESPRKAILTPSHGRGIGASKKPLNEYQKKPGDQVGHYWRVPATSKRVTRHVVADVNYWKTFAAERLRTAHGDPGSISIFRPDARSGNHRLLIEHLTSEYPVPVTAPEGRRVDEWQLTPGRDNEFWDGLVGCCVAASMQGIVYVGHSVSGKRKYVKLSDMQGGKR